ncbi:hypothetical protein CSUI_008729 [Cystoisospora suis]|uniref:Transmembrane protein n=1 Tax=Cystoisospora suis TaxID=483139 RepID=A0A2C6KJZ7_9APIC|nr:hypothetical protein CSUI_008729 [Cystoisospora suis]
MKKGTIPPFFFVLFISFYDRHLTHTHILSLSLYLWMYMYTCVYMCICIYMCV